MATSQNGWRADQDRKALGVNSAFSAGGVLIAGGVLAGDVETVLGYVAREFHKRVEPLVAGHCWGHAYRPVRGQTSGYSNHASGTAIDLNAPAHPIGKRGTFNTKQVAAIRAILREVGGVVRWGGDYTSRPDEMHFEINAGAAAVRSAANKLKQPTMTPPKKTETTVAITDADADKIALAVEGYRNPAVAPAGWDVYKYQREAHTEAKKAREALTTQAQTLQGILAALQALTDAINGQKAGQ